jgi:hypothetical protein
MPVAGFAPLPYQYAPVAAQAPPSYRYVPGAAPPRPQPHYAGAMNGGNQYDQYRDNQMPYAAREDLQPQRQCQPNPYQQQQDDYQQRNARDRRDLRARSVGASTIYSEESYYRLRR